MHVCDADGGQAAAGAAKNAAKRGGIAEAEARMILNVKPKASETEINEVTAFHTQWSVLCVLAEANAANILSSHAGTRKAHGDERPGQGRVRIFAEEDSCRSKCVDRGQIAWRRCVGCKRKHEQE